MNVKSQLKSGFGFATLLGSAATAVVCGWLMTDPERMRTDFIAEVSSPTGVLVRHGSEIDWREVNQAKLFDGSLVEVPLHGSAVLKIGHHQEETLEAGSIVRVSQEDGRTLTETALKRDARTGALEFRKTTEVGKNLGVDTAEVRLLTPMAEPTADVPKIRRLGSEIQKSYDRTLTLEYVVANTRYPQLHVFGAFDDFSVRPINPPIGTMYKPTLTQSPCIGFVWSPIPVNAVNYVLEISKTHNFEYFRSFSTAKNFMYVRMNEPSDYFWRIRALHGSQTLIGETARFTVHKPPMDPEAARKQQVVRRVREINAWLMDVEYCGE